nr:ribonuclease H-like domain-containing protein [Tanacetum cinerariifolium]
MLCLQEFDLFNQRLLANSVLAKPHSPPRRHINRNPSLKASNFPPKLTAAKAPIVNAVKGNSDIQVSYGLGPKEELAILFLVQGNPQHALKDKGVIGSGCSRHMTGNMSYLSDFEELNGGYVAFGGNPKGGKISGKDKIRTEKLDFDDVYFVKELKFNLFSVSQMCDKKNSVLFTHTECLVLSPEFKLPDKNQAINLTLVQVSKNNLMQKKKGRKMFNNMCFFLYGLLVLKILRTLMMMRPLEVRSLGRKPESEVHVSPSSSAKTKKHDDKTKREAKVPAVGQISTNSTNTFSAAGPSNTAISPTHGKSSYIDTSQYPDDPNMPELDTLLILMMKKIPI